MRPRHCAEGRDRRAIRECLNCNKGCVDAIQNRKYISCVLNAENGDEATIAIKPGEGDKKIAVVGGGIAGLEARAWRPNAATT